LAYPKIIIAQAKELYESGSGSNEDIIKALKIKHRRTLHEWIVRYKWQKNKKTSQPQQELHDNCTPQVITNKIEQTIERNTREWVEDQASLGVLMAGAARAKISIIEPEKLSVRDAIDLAVKGTEIERKARTGNEENGNNTFNFLTLVKISGVLDD